MKKTFLSSTIVAFCALLLIPAARAQTPTYASQTLGTFVVAGAAATNVAYVIDCRKQATVTLCMSNTMSSSATDNQTIAFSRSVDGINYNTTLSTIALAPVTGALSIQSTNINSQGCGYIKINYFTNAAATDRSTNVLFYAIKISAP